MKFLSGKAARRALALVGSWCLVGTAHAQAADLPWATPLETIGDSLTGPVARAIGVLALAASGGMLAFGGELGDFTKRLMMVVLAIATMILAGNIMNIFQG